MAGLVPAIHVSASNIRKSCMPNGKPGDHPYTDIITHGRDVYSPRAASLVREIARLSDDKTQRGLADLLYFEYNEFGNPVVSKLETVLVKMRDKALQDARERRF
jgi:S-adenosylmethionine hydrolase